MSPYPPAGRGPLREQEASSVVEDVIQSIKDYININTQILYLTLYLPYFDVAVMEKIASTAATVLASPPFLQ